jgi:predicted metal-dependent hydrolase
MHPLFQFTRDLFEPNQPPALDGQARVAIKNEVIEAPAPTLLPAPTAAFQHPRANREARLGEAVVAFEFKRGQRRTIGFSVGPQGLVVSAPKWVPLHQVDAAVQDKARWILQKLNDTRLRHDQLLARRTVWQDGATFAFMGAPVTVALVTATGRHKVAPVLLTSSQSPQSLMDPFASNMPGRVLQLSLPAEADGPQIQAAVQQWLIGQARPLFVARLDHFAPLLQVQWRQLALSNAATRWGSARMGGAIRLNWRLMHFPLPVIDYVVAHELSHLRVMDHSPRFWSVVASVVPNYAELRQQLKDDAIPRWL